MGSVSRVSFKHILPALIAIGISAVTNASDNAMNGFDLSDTSVPAGHIIHGGPPRDGIPPLEYPKFVNADQADFIKPDDPVLGLDYRGVQKAYPIKILDFHELVNDKFAGQMVLVSYCPLCGSGLAFLSQAGDRPLTFGVSGLLYDNDLLMYDRQTESLWLQIAAEAISGPFKGHKLDTLLLERTTWADWSARHPETELLSIETGFQRNYGIPPYGNYAASEVVYFPVNNVDHRLHPKELVLGVEVDGKRKAYPLSQLAKTKNPLHDKVNGTDLIVHYDAVSSSARIFDSNGNPYPSTSLYWFAWFSFYPETGLFLAD